MTTEATPERRDFLRSAARGAAVMTLTLGVGGLVRQHGLGAEEFVWQVDPVKCTECGKCATHCVLYPIGGEGGARLWPLWLLRLLHWLL